MFLSLTGARVSKLSSMQTGDKKQFKIVIVDDNITSVHTYVKEIHQYLKDEYNLELVPIEVQKATEALDKIDETVDIAVIDKNLGTGDDAEGIKLVDSIRKRQPLLDILIYTAGNMKQEDLEMISDCGMVDIVRDRKQFVDRLQTLIDRNLSKWRDIVYLRGMAISRIVDLEGEINDVLMEIFSPHEKSRKKFRSFLLENPHITLFAKKKILSKVANPKNGKPFTIGDLDTLQEFRNVLAHCKRSKTDSNILIQMDNDVQVSSSTIKEMFAKAERFSNDLKSFKQAKANSTAST